MEAPSGGAQAVDVEISRFQLWYCGAYWGVKPIRH